MVIPQPRVGGVREKVSGHEVTTDQAPEDVDDADVVNDELTIKPSIMAIAARTS